MRVWALDRLRGEHAWRTLDLPVVVAACHAAAQDQGLGVDLEAVPALKDQFHRRPAKLDVVVAGGGHDAHSVLEEHVKTCHLRCLLAVTAARISPELEAEPRIILRSVPLHFWSEFFGAFVISDDLGEHGPDAVDLLHVDGGGAAAEVQTDRYGDSLDRVRICRIGVVDLGECGIDGLAGHVETDLVENPSVDPCPRLALDLVHVGLTQVFLVFGQGVWFVDRAAVDVLLDQAGGLDDEFPILGLHIAASLVLAHFGRQGYVAAHVGHPMALYGRVHVHPAAIPCRAGTVLHGRVSRTPGKKLVYDLLVGELPFVLEKPCDLVGCQNSFRRIWIGQRQEDNLAVDRCSITGRMIALQMVEHGFGTDECPPDFLGEPFQPCFHGCLSQLLVGFA